MKAMILAAGLGTRLRPLTDDRPKALVEVAGHTLLEIALIRLRSFGVREVIINVHHFADMIVEYLESNASFGMRIEVSREETLLDTGGGLKKATHFFLEDSNDSDVPFFVYNVDVISNLDLGRLLQCHTEQRALATLAVQERLSSRYLLFDQQLQLCGRRIGPSSETEWARSCEKPQALAFCGIHVISPRVLGRLQEKGAFSIIDAYLRLAAQGANIVAFRADEYYWRDAGSPANLRQAAEDLAQRPLL
jgi:NDP-sugar pyrophosphorylase family protein